LFFFTIPLNLWIHFKQTEAASFSEKK